MAAKVTGETSGFAYHPRPDDRGRPVRIALPTKPSPTETWKDPKAVAVFVPDGSVPPVLNGVPMAPARPPVAGWVSMIKAPSEPNPSALVPKPGKKAAAGAVMLEPDGRVWLYEPTNHYGGYHLTFPKGTLEANDSPQATAAKEVFEETGLLVEVRAFLLDCDRSLSLTRFFLARRIGGSPSAMGWEAQAVWLVPLAQLREHASNRYDAPVVQALLRLSGSSAS